MDGLTHSDIGAWLCNKWKLPDDIRNIIEYHHKPLLATANKDEVKLVYLGDTISTAYYEKLLGVKPNLMFSKMILESVGAAEDAMNNISRVLPDEVEKVRHLGMFEL